VRAGKHYNIIVTFRAHVAVTNAGTAYEITERKQGARTWASGATQRNLRAGELVRQTFSAMRAGMHHGSVRYQPHANGPFGDTLHAAILVGRWSVRVPSDRRP
jgi:hypothetical protein